MKGSGRNTSGLILDFIKSHPSCSSKEIHNGLEDIGYATIKRMIQTLIVENLVTLSGRGKSTKYEISQAYELIRFIDVENYFLKEIDERDVQNHFNHSLIKETLTNVSLFTIEELHLLTSLQKQYTENITKLTPTEYSKELERLAIDLSWKSSQIEGNTLFTIRNRTLAKREGNSFRKNKR